MTAPKPIPGVLDALPRIDLRDHFAGLAMQAVLSRPNLPFDAESIRDLADTAYEMADAMLAVRTKREPLRANPAPVFEAPDGDADEPIPFRPATLPPPAIAGADAAADAGRELLRAFSHGGLDELEPASETHPETIPAPPAESDVDASWGGLTAARGPLRHCEDPKCGCAGGGR